MSIEQRDNMKRLMYYDSCEAPKLDSSGEGETSGSKAQTDLEREGPGSEMAQWSRALHAIPEVPGSVPSTHTGQLTMASKSKGFDSLSGLPGHPHIPGTQAQYT